MTKQRRMVLVLLVLVLLIGVVAGIYVAKSGVPFARHTRTLTVQNITIEYSGRDALAVIVQSREAGVARPWAFAMLGGTSGQLNLPQALPAGAEAVFLFGLGADIAPAVPDGAPPIESATLRGISGAHSERPPLQFRNPKELASIAFKAGGPPILLRVTTKDGRLVLGEPSR